MSQYNSKNYTKQGGEETVIGGTLQVLTGAKILPNSGTQAATIADIANDASGTAIATAVNAIIAALKGAGIIASE